MRKHAADNSAASKSTGDTFVFQKGGSQEIWRFGTFVACDGREKKGKAIHSFNTHLKQLMLFFMHVNVPGLFANILAVIVFGHSISIH